MLCISVNHQLWFWHPSEVGAVVKYFTPLFSESNCGHLWCWEEMPWGRKADNLHETCWVFTGGEKTQPENTYVHMCVRVCVNLHWLPENWKFPSSLSFYSFSTRPRRRCLRAQIHLTVNAELSVALKWEKGGNNPKVTEILLQSPLVVS